MLCYVLCLLVILCAHDSALTLASDMTDNVEEVTNATCHIVAGNLVARANATSSRTLKGVCTKKDLAKVYQDIREEFNFRINQIKEVLSDTNYKLDQVLKGLSSLCRPNSGQNNFDLQLNGSRNNIVKRTQSRDLEIRKTNYTLHNDVVTGEKVFSYFWRIDDVQNKIKNEKQEVVISPKFYINGGYRMYIKMFPQQNKGNVYIHVGLTHGINDDKLEWPFPLKHKVVIVDQSLDTAEDIKSQVWDPAELCSSSDWQKPSPNEDNEECVSFGFSQDTLSYNSYTVNDSLLIKLDVFLN